MPVQTSDRQSLVRLLKAKVEEIRCNIIETCSRKEFEELLDTYYLSEEIFTERENSEEANTDKNKDTGGSSHH